MARAEAPEAERVVHGTVATPTGTRFHLPEIEQSVIPEQTGVTTTLDPQRVIEAAARRPLGTQVVEPVPVDVVVENPLDTSPVTVPGQDGLDVHARCVAAQAGSHETGWVIDDLRPGRIFELTADAGPWEDDFDIAFYESLDFCAESAPAPSLSHPNQAGDEHGVVPETARVALVTLVSGNPGAAFTYREPTTSKPPWRARDESKPTVIAVLEFSTNSGFSPYHFDFLGHQHPWNRDDNLENDFDFHADPVTWLPTYPGATAVDLTLPGPDDGGMDVSGLSDGVDKPAWDGMKTSTPTATSLYRFPGTKVVGAIHFGPDPTSKALVYGSNDAHGTRSASVAGGNIHGTCPECVFVWVTFTGSEYTEAIDWVAEQDWIDVVTNSWVNPTYATYDVTHLDHPNETTRPAVEGGQAWVWGAGNGHDNFFVAPNQTYGWNEHAADWIVDVGGVAADGRQIGAGRPADIAAYADTMRSAGTTKANGVGGHSGTSNAAPVVAGTMARMIQWGRELLGDTTPGHHEGVVAEGRPVPCEMPVALCPLEDGRLDRAEVQRVLFGNVLPSTVRPPSGVSNLTQVQAEYGSTPAVLTYTGQGHGIVYGARYAGRYVAEQRRLLDALRGDELPFDRPPGEQNWMFADSKCRQRLWGSWSGGYYQPGAPDPAWDPTTDQPAIALNAACTALPERPQIS